VDRFTKLFSLGILFLLLSSCNLPLPLADRETPLPNTTQLLEITLPPTPTWTPAPTPTPTPLPAARIVLGDRALFNGDWEAALREFQTARDTAPEADARFAARVGIARAHFLAGETLEAQSLLEELVGEENAVKPALSEAYFYLGQVYTALDLNAEAAAAYAKYLELRPGVIESYVQELRGDALSAAGDYQGAISAYQAAIASPRLNDDQQVEIKLAQSYHFSGDLPTAIVAYQDIYSRASNDFTKAQLDWWLGQAYTELGDLDQAYAAYQDAVANYPLSNDSYLALVELVDAGVPVSELDRGLVDYFAGEYGVAIAAFDRYLRADPEDPATALYYFGLSQSALGEYQGALDTWDKLIRDYPESDRWDDAWEEIADTLWIQRNEFRQATRTLLDFVAQAPIHPRAPELLFAAARIAERGDRLGQAAEIWERVASEYPTSELAGEALFLAGISLFRLEDFVAAHSLFQRQLGQSSDPGLKSAALFWIGKTEQAQGNEEVARAAWGQAAELDPTGYYSERALDLLAGRAAFEPPLQYDFGIDFAAERKEAEDWMRTIFQLPDDIDLGGLGDMVGDPRFQRGEEFWRLGLYEEARTEFEDLRQSVETDPVNSYRLANYLLELSPDEQTGGPREATGIYSTGLYRAAIFAARQVLTLAGMSDAATLSAPVYFNHIRFGLYYQDLIVAASQEFDFHPLFLFSVMRQESLFEGFVSSSAGARGLMQILPSTGEEIAARLRWPEDFTPEDLYRPAVSIRLGANYLDRQRGFMDGDLYGMLAAYNGGPGNASIWMELAPSDPDLFLEVIRLDEPRQYIMSIYEIFNIYRQLYNRTP
jgi:soluble lytic murein transglycosylase